MRTSYLVKSFINVICCVFIQHFCTILTVRDEVPPCLLFSLIPWTKNENFPIFWRQSHCILQRTKKRHFCVISKHIPSPKWNATLSPPAGSHIPLSLDLGDSGRAAPFFPKNVFAIAIRISALLPPTSFTEAEIEFLEIQCFTGVWICFLLGQFFPFAVGNVAFRKTESRIFEWSTLYFHQKYT